MSKRGKTTSTRLTGYQREVHDAVNCDVLCVLSKRMKQTLHGVICNMQEASIHGPREELTSSQKSVAAAQVKTLPPKNPLHSSQCQHVDEGLTQTGALQAAARSNSLTRSGYTGVTDNEGRPEEAQATQAAIRIESYSVQCLLPAFYTSFNPIAAANLGQSNLTT